MTHIDNPLNPDPPSGRTMAQAPSLKRWFTDWIASWRNPDAHPLPLLAGPSPARAIGTPPLPDQRQRRNTRRKALYMIIKEEMVRAGVPSRAYKFKVLSLDPEGESHLVLIDIQSDALRHVHGGPSAIESGLRQLARDRVQLMVTSVYWRELEDGRGTAPPAQGGSRVAIAHEDITHDEIAALQQALAARHPYPGAEPGPDFEATRPMARRPARQDHPLSDTQMGDLQ